MGSFARKTVALAAVAALCLAAGSAAFAQTKPAATPAPAAGTEKTVEEAYLQGTLETMIIREQAYSDTRDMKLVALQYARQALDAGRKNEEMRQALEFLALESTLVVARSAGTGRPTNDFPDIRAKACDLLGEFPSVETKDALVKVALSEKEPMVLSAAFRSLGKIGMNEADEVTQVIAFTIKRFDILYPDNSLAFECLVALERLAEKNKGLKDPAAVQAVMRIATGNYITPVKAKANELLGTLRRLSAGK